MKNLLRWLDRRVGKRNLPFLLAVVALAIAIIVLMAVSPGTESGNDPRSPPSASE